MLSARLRAPAGLLLLWPARALARLGVHPGAVTVAGTVGVVASASWLWPRGHLVAGVLAVAVFALFDSLDGTLARRSGQASRWGAVLDSTLDRVADAAIAGSLALWAHRTGDELALVLCLALMGFGATVPYVRARAEALGVRADVGPAERTDRIAVVLLGVLAVGLGAPLVLLHLALAVVVVGCVVTIGQRLSLIHRATTADPGELGELGDQGHPDGPGGTGDPRGPGDPRGTGDPRGPGDPGHPGGPGEPLGPDDHSTGRPTGQP